MAARPVTPAETARARAVMPARRDDAGHLVGLERGAADERPVDRRLGQELADVGRRDAAAVQDRERAGTSPQPMASSVARMASAIAAASMPVALRPVPIAQTGS